MPTRLAALLILPLLACALSPLAQAQGVSLLEVSLSQKEAATAPGDRVFLQVFVQNNDDKAHEVAVSHEWQAQPPAENVTIWAPRRWIEPGQKATFNVTMDVLPDAADGRHALSIRVGTTSTLATEEVTFHLLVGNATGPSAEEAPPMEVALRPAEVAANPGDRVFLQVWVRNNDDAPHDVGVSHRWLDNPPAAENVTVWGSYRFLQPGEEALVNVTMDVLPDAPGGRHVLLVVVDTSASDHEMAFNLVVGNAAPPPTGEPRFTTDALLVEARRGETVWREITIRNEGEGPVEDARLLVNVTAPENGSVGWNFTLPDPFRLPAGDKRTVPVGFTPRGDAPTRAALHLWVADWTGWRDRMDVQLRVMEGPEIHVEVRQEGVDVQRPSVIILGAGGNATALVRVWGESNATLAPFHLEIEAQALPEGMILELTKGEYPARAAARLLVEARGNGSGAIEVFLVVRGEDGALLARVPVQVIVTPPTLPHIPPGFNDTAVDAAALGPAEGVALGAATVGAGALVLAGSHRRWPLAFAALYTRLRPARLLEQPVRRAVVDLVRNEPGITMADVQRRLGLANGQASHHVRRLVQARILVVTPDGGARRLTLREAGRAATVEDRVLACLREGRARGVRDLAEALGLSRQAVHRHVKRLHDQGRVVVGTDGMRLVIRAAGEG